MFEDQLRVKNAGIKYKRNPIYEMQEIKLFKLEDIPKGIKPDRYAELVEPDFVGKLAIAYQKDNIGQSGGNPQWCYIYECNHGKLTYRGTAIHKCADADVTDQNYNEMIYSKLAQLLFDSDNIKFPIIDLVKNLEWPEDKPAVLSYNIVQREQNQTHDMEEMIIMKTIAFNLMQRQDIHNSRMPLPIMLDAVKMQVQKKVGFEKKKAREIIDDAILSAKIAREVGDRKPEISRRARKTFRAYNAGNRQY